MMHRTCAVILPLHCDHVQRSPGSINSVMDAMFAVYEDLMQTAHCMFGGVGMYNLLVVITRFSWATQHMSHFVAKLSDAIQN